MANQDEQGVVLRPWQWAEMALLIVLMCGQVELTFTVLEDRPGLNVLVSLLPIALMVHMYMWLVPMWKARQR